MNIDKHATIAHLRSAIRSQESASRALRQEINALRAGGPATGPDRSMLHQRKQALGCDTRALLLALAMVRGRTYRSVEATARETVPVVQVTRAALGISLDWRSVTSAEMSACMSHVDAVAAWAKGGPSPVTYAEPVAVAA